MNKGIRFTDEFKRDAVAQVVERGYAVSEVAERLGISTKSLYTWKAHFFEVTTCQVRGCGSGCRDQTAEARTGAGYRGTWHLKKGCGLCPPLVRGQWTRAYFARESQ